MKLVAAVWNWMAAGTSRKPQGLLAVLVVALSLAIAAFQIYVNITGTLEPYLHSMIFMSTMLALAIILQSPGKGSKGVAWVDYLLAFLMLALTVYIYLNGERLVTRFPLVDQLTPLDIFFGMVAVVAIFESMRRTLGHGLTLVVTALLIYVFTGHLLEGPFYHRLIDLPTFLDQMVFTINGAAGTPMRVAATYAFIFVTLGAFLERSGGGDFFYKLANGLAGGQVGGPAKVAIVSSAAFGMISGSPTADVATTGSFTIPLMKKMGYSPVFAGAVEATASTGGAIMPPIMGTAAFLMVEFTGTPYRQIAIAAILPAFLYYFGQFMQIHFRSIKWGITGLPKEELPRIWHAFRDRGEFLIPFGALIYLIFIGFTPTLAGIVSLALTIPTSWVRRDSRMGPREIATCLAGAIGRMAPLVAACAAAGLVVGGLNVTGLASKFITLANQVAGGNPFLALLLSAFVLILLGMGMPLPSVYILGAALIAPVLTEVGIPIFQAHLFIVFFSALSAITPPVAVAAFTAAGIAEADPMQIGWQAVRMAIAGFLVPFIFVFQPALLLIGAPLEILWAFLTATTGVLCLAAAAEGFAWIGLVAWQRLLLLLAGVTLVIPGLSTDLVGFAAAALVVFYALRRKGAVDLRG